MYGGNVMKNKNVITVDKSGKLYIPKMTTKLRFHSSQ